jgi:NAD(P)H-hydrate epimerase
MMSSMLILSAAEMKACDLATSENFGISPSRLMLSAADAVFRFVRLQFPFATRITVLCGRGNNGGDGLHTARLLAESGSQVTVLLLGDPSGLKGEPAEAWSLLVRNPGLVKTQIVLSPEDLEGLRTSLTADLILDAVLGTGFHPPLQGLPLAALEWLQRASAPILAVDLPSGWDADSSASTFAPAFPADAVLTFTAPKPAHVFGLLTRRWDQPIAVAPIGSPAQAVVSAQNLLWAGDAKSLTETLRPADSNKGSFGHVLVVGGSLGKSGAPAMAALAAMRSGAGLVTAAVPAPQLPLVASIAPELMTLPLLTDEYGQISPENLSPGRLNSLLNRITVLALGPGLGTTRQASDFALAMLAASAIPIVADADALNALENHSGQLASLARDRFLVLTPHPGEMSRLTGRSIAEIQANRLQIAREFAVRLRLTLVLKGSRTIIAHPDGSVAVNTSGNPAMAKGGSGDLLTGIIAGLLAQYPDDPKRAVEAAVYLHGLAADFALRDHDQHTLLATDLLTYLPQAFRYLSQAHSGYCWLQGLPAESSSAAQGHKEHHG